MKNREEDKLEELRRAREREMQMMLEARLDLPFKSARLEGLAQTCPLKEIDQISPLKEQAGFILKEVRFPLA